MIMMMMIDNDSNKDIQEYGSGNRNGGDDGDDGDGDDDAYGWLPLIQNSKLLT